MTHGRLARQIISCGALLLIAAVAGAQTVPVTLSWTAPTNGAPVDHYKIYWSIDGEDYREVTESDETSAVVECEVGTTYRFRISGVSEHGLEGILSESSDEVDVAQGQQDQGAPPAAPSFQPNFPNPFNPETTIRYGIPNDRVSAEGARLEIYDMRGTRVRLLPANPAPGWHEVVWNGKDDLGQTQPSGQYFVRLLTGGEVATWKMTMVK